MVLAIVKSVSMISIHGVPPTPASTLGWKAMGQTQALQKMVGQPSAEGCFVANSFIYLVN